MATAQTLASRRLQAATSITNLLLLVLLSSTTMATTAATGASNSSENHLSCEELACANNNVCFTTLSNGSQTDHAYCQCRGEWAGLRCQSKLYVTPYSISSYSVTLRLRGETSSPSSLKTPGSGQIITTLSMEDLFITEMSLSVWNVNVSQGCSILRPSPTDSHVTIRDLDRNQTYMFCLANGPADLCQLRNSDPSVVSRKPNCVPVTIPLYSEALDIRLVTIPISIFIFIVIVFLILCIKRRSLFVQLLLNVCCCRKCYCCRKQIIRRKHRQIVRKHRNTSGSVLLPPDLPFDDSMSFSPSFASTSLSSNAIGGNRSSVVSGSFLSGHTPDGSEEKFPVFVDIEDNPSPNLLSNNPLLNFQSSLDYSSNSITPFLQHHSEGPDNETDLNFDSRFGSVLADDFRFPNSKVSDYLSAGSDMDASGGQSVDLQTFSDEVFDDCADVNKSSSGNTLTPTTPNPLDLEFDTSSAHNTFRLSADMSKSRSYFDHMTSQPCPSQYTASSGFESSTSSMRGESNNPIPPLPTSLPAPTSTADVFECRTNSLKRRFSCNESENNTAQNLFSLPPFTARNKRYSLPNGKIHRQYSCPTEGKSPPGAIRVFPHGQEWTKQLFPHELDQPGAMNYNSLNSNLRPFTIRPRNQRRQQRPIRRQRPLSYNLDYHERFSNLGDFNYPLNNQNVKELLGLPQLPMSQEAFAVATLPRRYHHHQKLQLQQQHHQHHPHRRNTLNTLNNWFRPASIYDPAISNVPPHPAYLSSTLPHPRRKHTQSSTSTLASDSLRNGSEGGDSQSTMRSDPETNTTSSHSSQEEPPLLKTKVKNLISQFERTLPFRRQNSAKSNSSTFCDEEYFRDLASPLAFEKRQNSSRKKSRPMSYPYLFTTATSSVGNPQSGGESPNSIFLGHPSQHVLPPFTTEEEEEENVNSSVLNQNRRTQEQEISNATQDRIKPARLPSKDNADIYTTPSADDESVNLVTPFICKKTASDDSLNETSHLSRSPLSNNYFD